MLAITHVAIAGATSTPEMVLDESEARILAEGVVPVLDLLDFTPDPRFAAAFGLAVACGRVYGPRVVLIRARKVQEAEDKKAAKAKPVYPSTSQPNGGGGFQPDLTATIPPEMMAKGPLQ